MALSIESQFCFCLTGEKRALSTCESARRTNDRLTLLECDHSRLVVQTDARFAESQEFEDFVQNRSEEDWIEITGSLF